MADISVIQTPDGTSYNIKDAAAYAAAITNVDSTPTPNSTHLVTSGGVASYISAITDAEIDTLFASS